MGFHVCLSAVQNHFIPFYKRIVSEHDVCFHYGHAFGMIPKIGYWNTPECARILTGSMPHNVHCVSGIALYCTVLMSKSVLFQEQNVDMNTVNATA